MPRRSSSKGEPASRTTAGPTAAALPNRRTAPSRARSTRTGARRDRSGPRRRGEKSKGSMPAGGRARPIGGFFGALPLIIGSCAPLSFPSLAAPSVESCRSCPVYTNRTSFLRAGPRPRRFRVAARQPRVRAIWLIEADGADVGYMVVTICVSLEFGGRFALLDEFYLDPRGAARASHRKPSISPPRGRAPGQCPRCAWKPPLTTRTPSTSTGKLASLSRAPFDDQVLIVKVNSDCACAPGAVAVLDLLFFRA